MADRREFSAAVKAKIRERAGGVCECHLMPADIRGWFPQTCDREPVDIDHIYADVLEDDKSEPLTADDGAHLCKACHQIKSKSDQAMRKKRNAHKVRKDRPKAKKRGTGQIKSAGFRGWRKMNGEPKWRDG